MPILQDFHNKSATVHIVYELLNHVSESPLKVYEVSIALVLPYPIMLLSMYVHVHAEPQDHVYM